MPTYRYQSVNAVGQPVEGLVEADGVQQAIAQLVAAGLAVQAISVLPENAPPDETALPAASADIETSRRPTFASAVRDEQSVLRDHMTNVVEQAEAIVPALRAFAEEMPDVRRRRELLDVCRLLKQGDPAAAAAAFESLPEYWIPLLSAATASSDPGRLLREFLAESQRTDDLQRQWRLTLAYPAIIVVAAIALLLGFAAFVAPAFREIFDDFGLRLPGITIFILNVSHWVVSPAGLLTLGAVVALLLALAVGPRGALGGWLNDRLGALFGRATAVAQYARFTADLLEAGVDMPSALRIVGFTSRRPRLRDASWSLARDIDSGTSAPNRPDQRPLTASVLHALQADMPTASRARLLKEISLCYADRMRTRLSWTQGAIQPIAIAVIGGVVLLVVLALFVPLVDLINNLSG